MAAHATQLAAHASISTVAPTVQEKVYEAIVSFGPEGLTTNECADLLDIDKGTIQPRTSELFADGRIIDSGKRRPNASGKKAIVWQAA